MIGDTFKETAIKRKDGVFWSFGITPKLRSIFGAKKDEPIYEIEFEIIEEKAVRPKGHTNDIIYYALYDKDYNGNFQYSLIQPTAELFAMQFPYDVWKEQGKFKGIDILGNESYFGIVVRIEPINYIELKEK